MWRNTCVSRALTDKGMRIGFDAKKIVSNLTGIGNYSRDIINALTAYSDAECVLFAPEKGSEECRKRLRVSSRLDFVYPSWRNKFLREWWRCRGMVAEISRHHISLYHGLSNELPFGIRKAGCKSVVTIHDLIFLRYPSTYDWLSRLILKYKTHYACHHADCIVAISQQTKRDIMHYYHIPGSKIMVIYQGCNGIYRQSVNPLSIANVREKYGLPGLYLLSVGTFEARKNHLSMLKAVARLSADIHLVLVSKPTSYQAVIVQAIEKLGLRKRVHILNGVPNADLPSLYQGAGLFLYLSYFEGFGIPVLEAVTQGVPVVAATGSCLEEAGGDGAVYCPPFDDKAIAEQIAYILNNKEVRSSLSEAGLRHAKSFTDEHIAAEYTQLYRHLVKGKEGEL